MGDPERERAHDPEGERAHEGEDERGVGRLMAFTDGVVAIAITLIVLPLVDAAQELSSKPAAEFLHDNARGLAAAALSFVVIASFWKEHHRLYQGVTGSTRSLVNANLLWIVGIVFLPLPTVLVVGSPGGDPVAAALYIGTILVSQVALRLQILVIVRRGLLRTGARPPVASLRPGARLWTDWIMVGLTAAALAIAVALPVTSLYPLLLILLARPITWLIRRRPAPRHP